VVVEAEPQLVAAVVCVAVAAERQLAAAAASVAAERQSVAAEQQSAAAVSVAVER
jgi:hypothetical protein